MKEYWFVCVNFSLSYGITIFKFPVLFVLSINKDILILSFH